MRIFPVIACLLGINSFAVADDTSPAVDKPTGLQDIALRIGDKLRLARREADLKKLQQEVAELRSSLGFVEPEILVKVQVIELSRGKILGEIPPETRPKSIAEKFLPRKAGTTDELAHWGAVEVDHELLKQVDAWLADPTRPAKLLAEPILATVAGKPAWFNAGGEFPVVIPQSFGAVSVEYRRFGTQLDILPTMLDDGRVRLNVRPRISEIDPARSVTINGNQVPGLAVREIDTTVDIAPQQMLAIGGLIQTRVTAVSERTKAGNKKSLQMSEVELLFLISVDILPQKPDIVTDADTRGTKKR